MRLVFAALAAALLAGGPARADTLIDNVNGYTLDGKGALLRFTGLVVEDGGGTVKQLLQRKDKRPERPSYRFDGKGRTLIPGLIDAHGHVMGLGLRAMSVDLSGARSLEEALARIRAYAAANPAQRWIVGGGWNQEAWNLGRFPTAAELDSAVADRPVWLVRIDGHAGWANSLAIRAAALGPKPQSPPGGRIELSGGQPAGVFVDAAMQLIEKAVPAPLPRTRDEAFAKAQEILLSAGLTTVEDMGTDLDGWQVMRRAADRNALRLRILSYGDGIDTALRVGGTAPTPWLYGGRLKMVGVKLYADGALGSRGAWLKADYKDMPKERGHAFHNDAELKNLMSRAAMDGFQVAVHAIGDAANRQLLDAIEELSGTYKGDRRWRVEHAQIVDPVDLPRFGLHGTIASMQPVHLASDWRMAEARMGSERLAGSYAWATMLQNKVPLAFGSDFPVESPNPFAGLAVAVSREDAQGQPPGGWTAQQKLSLLQAFAGFTTGAAYAAFAEDRLGTLEPRRMADFLFIDRDIFAEGVTPQLIRGTQVLETWVGGRRVWQRPAGGGR